MPTINPKDFAKLMKLPAPVRQQVLAFLGATGASGEKITQILQQAESNTSKLGQA
jgi:hypothetical protein